MADGNLGLEGAAVRARDFRRGPLRPVHLLSVRQRIDGASLVRIIRYVDCTALIGGALVTCSLVEDSADLITMSAAALAILGMHVSRGYEFPVAERMWSHHARIAAAMLLTGVCVAAYATLRPEPSAIPAIALWVVVSGAVIFGAHAIWFCMIAGWRRSGKLKPNIVLVGATDAAERLIAAALVRNSIHILGIFDDRANRAGPNLLGVPVLGTADQLINHRILPSVDRVVLALPLSATNRISDLLGRLSEIPNNILLLADGGDVDDAVQRLLNAPLAHLTTRPQRGSPLVKRIVDITASMLALLLLAPIFVAIVLAIKRDSPGPAFFKQRRHGYLNEEVVVWKFRSMRVETEDMTASRQVTVDDERVTRVGRLLRRTSLDELPQLLNVLRGEMSIVGPRPHAIGMLAGGRDATQLAEGYAKRHRMKPGITGWAAINGSRGPADTAEAIQERIGFDLEYAQRQSFWLDLRIILMTVPCLFGDEGVR